MYQLTVTEEQLQAIRDACEIKARLHLGQFDDALRCCYNQYGVSVIDYDTIRAVEAIIKPIQGLRPNSSWGGWGVSYRRSALGNQWHFAPPAGLGPRLSGRDRTAW